MQGWRRWAGVVALVVGVAGCRDSDELVSIEDYQPYPEEGTPDGPPGLLPISPDSIPEVTWSPPAPPVAPHDVFDPTPTEGKDGVPGIIPGVYTDKGAAPPDQAIRGLISFPIRNKEALAATIDDLYDPSSPNFRKYMTVQQWMSQHAPSENDVRVVADWITSRGMKVERVATNRLLLHFTGTVAQFNDTFGVQLRIFDRKSPQAGNDPHEVYGLLDQIVAPKGVVDRIHAIVALDLPVEPGPLPGEAGTVGAPPSDLQAFTPEQIAHAYDFDDLHAMGFRGAGARLGVTVGAAFRFKDIRGFWQHMGITRDDPQVVVTMEPPATRYRETTLDVQWAGAMAPEAELIVYQGPDARNTSMIYTVNEAVARNEVDVITTSFAHREDSEPRAVHEAYDHAAMMAAALGITVLSASGDSSNTDVPATSPYVTAVGGTNLTMNGNAFVSEVTWPDSGSGYSRTFARPWWQDGVHTHQRRAVADVALNSGEPYTFVFLGDWWPNYGTSFASPVFAAMLSTVNGARAAQGKPRVGWLNAHLYTRSDVQATFRDIKDGSSWYYPSGPGWDIPTGWGAPSAVGLYQTLP